MVLYEHEGKKILNENGIVIPKYQLLHSRNDTIKLTLPFYIKAQVLSGKRMAAGGIVKVDDINEAKTQIKKFFRRKSVTKKCPQYY